MALERWTDQRYDAIAIDIEGWDQRYFTFETEVYTYLVENQWVRIHIDNIEARLRSSTYSQVVQGIDHKDCFNGIQETLSRLDISLSVSIYICILQLGQGIKHIHDCIRSIRQSQVVEVNEEQIKQGMEHIQDCMTSIRQGMENIQDCTRGYINKLPDFLQRDKDQQNKQGIKHIQDCIRSIKRFGFVQGNHEQNKQEIELIQDCIRFTKVSELVQAYDERGLLEIEHSRDCKRSTKHYKESSKSGNQLGMEHIQGCMRSNERSEIVQANEHGNQQGIEYIRPCMRSEKLDEVVRVNKHEIQLGIEHVQGCMRSNERYEMVQENEYDIQLGIEYIRPFMRSNGPDEVVLVNEHEIQLGIEHVQGCMRSNERCEMVEENEYDIQLGIEYIRPFMRSNGPDEVVPGESENHQAFSDVRKTMQSAKLPRAMQGPKALQESIDYLLNQKMSTWFDELLELVKNNDQHGAEKLIMRPGVLHVIQLLDWFKGITNKISKGSSIYKIV